MKRLKVEIGGLIFHISVFCHKKVGDTENMKLKVKCFFHPEYNKEFDDIESLKNYFNGILENRIIDMIMEM